MKRCLGLGPIQTIEIIILGPIKLNPTKKFNYGADIRTNLIKGREKWGKHFARSGRPAVGADWTSVSGNLMAESHSYLMMRSPLWG